MGPVIKRAEPTLCIVNLLAFLILAAFEPCQCEPEPGVTLVRALRHKLIVYAVISHSENGTRIFDTIEQAVECYAL